VHTFRRRRKSTAEPLGRSPGLEGANRNLPIHWPLHLPRLLGRVVIEATRLHSQWRDRAGFSPDFPFMPLVGTQGKRG
jgi:hypothetical protein